MFSVLIGQNYGKRPKGNACENDMADGVIGGERTGSAATVQKIGYFGAV